MSTPSKATIHTLSDSGKTITAADDIRGRTVKDKDGEAIGKVLDLLIDDDEGKVRFLLVEHAGFLGFGQTQSCVPVDAITKISKDEVAINHSREHVAAAPPYDPGLIDDSSFHNSIYGHYGYLPFWKPGYMYPANVASISILRPLG